MTTKNICIFGDSIAYGAWSREGGWADRLQLALQRRTLDSGFQEYYFLYNASIPGDTSEDVARRFAVEQEARDPDVIVFAVGINDASSRGGRDGARVALGQFEKNMKALVEEAMTGRSREYVVVIGLTRVDEEHTTPFENTYFFNERIASYDTALHRICRESGARYVDVSRILASEDLADGLHPNDNGHEKMFRHILRFLDAEDVLR